MMKNIVWLFISFILFSCNENEETSIQNSEWKLSEIYMDPGDGSGDFSAVSSNKILIFYSDNTFTCSGNICALGIETENPTTGTVDWDNHKLWVENCIFSEIPFTLNENQLILYYPSCIEVCAMKYLKQ